MTTATTLTIDEAASLGVEHAVRLLKALVILPKHFRRGGRGIPYPLLRAAAHNSFHKEGPITGSRHGVWLPIDAQFDAFNEAFEKECFRYANKNNWEVEQLAPFDND